MDKLYFTVTDVPIKQGAYSTSKYLNNLYRYDKNKVIAGSESISFEPDKDKKGGIITFSTVVNAEELSSNKLVNWFKQKFASFKNKLFKNRKIDGIANKHNLVEWTIGNFLNGRYTAQNGKTYDENSLSVEIIGVTFDELIQIAEELCIEFLQESVLVKDYSSGRIVFVDAN